MKGRYWRWGLMFGLPVALLVLFRLVKHRADWMNRWVFGVVAPVERFLGRLWSCVSFSVAEVLVAVLLSAGLVLVLSGVVILVRKRQLRPLLRRVAAVAMVCLWLLVGLDWMWNAVYYAEDGFAKRANLTVQPYTVEELFAVTGVFLHRASALAARMPRDEQGRFAVSREECIRRGVTAYEGIEDTYAFLEGEGVPVKPLLCSKLQSRLGFTGIYFPFTGEANVNVDAPTCLLPATIAHEMAHQRMIAPEEEANFVGIAACLTGEDEVFEYSGYLMGLIHLSNALYRVAPEAWAVLWAEGSAELQQDWRENNAYWAARQSSVEQAAEQVYDSYLKGNNQDLGVRSYGACVDLLVTWMRTAE